MRVNEALPPTLAPALRRAARQIGERFDEQGAHLLKAEASNGVVVIFARGYAAEIIRELDDGPARNKPEM